MRSVGSCLLLALVVACSSSISPSAPIEAGTRDTAALDARTASDAHGADVRAHDAGSRDSGGTIDTGAIDANAHDAHAGGDATADARHVADAGQDAAGTCGGMTCFVGQSCVSGSCQFTGCTGSHVPGDYATVQAALTAVGGAAGGTICLAAQAYNETINTAGLLIEPVPITIQGVGPGMSILNGVNWAASGMTLSLVGLTIHQLLLQDANENATTISLRATTVDGVGAAATNDGALYAFLSYPLTLNLDGVDLSSGSTPYALEVGTLGGGVLTLNVVNSYIHGSTSGVSVSLGGALASELAATFENDTFESNGTAFIEPAGSGATLQFWNNLVVNNMVGVSTGGGSTFGNNAYFGNTTNFAGTAIAGTGVVEANPDLATGTSPPGLLAGSPCRGAGDPSHAPNHDFYGRARGASVDIGAVQSSP